MCSRRNISLEIMHCFYFLIYIALTSGSSYPPKNSESNLMFFKSSLCKLAEGTLVYNEELSSYASFSSLLCNKGRDTPIRVNSQMDIAYTLSWELVTQRAKWVLKCERKCQQKNSGFVKVPTAGIRGRTWIPLFQPGDTLTWEMTLLTRSLDSRLMDLVR